MRGSIDEKTLSAMRREEERRREAVTEFIHAFSSTPAPRQQASGPTKGRAQLGAHSKRAPRQER